MDRASVERLLEYVEEFEKDKKRLDWLSNQYVVVRIPLRYGSQECFQGCPDDTDGWEPEMWDLRGKIDKAIQDRGGNYV